MKFAAFVLTVLVLICSCGLAAQTTTPDFGPNVLIVDSHDKTVQQQITSLFDKQETNQFGSQRYACLFKPGNYDLDVQAGFYTQLLGLGRSPDDVMIDGGVRSMAGWMQGNATCNFWRSVENVAIIPSKHRGTAVWAVSQGTDLRRMHLRGSLNLWDGGWSSGGFLADCKVDGRVVSGSQQQWISRNADWGRWDGGVWNMVFVGVNHPPDGSWPEKPVTVIEQTPTRREKPYLFVDEAGKFFVMVPALIGKPSRGTSWEHDDSKAISIDDFYLAHAETDTAATINAALAAGKNLVVTPGIYHLESSIQVTRPDTVVLGLGYATLIPTTSAPAMVISDVDGVKVAGLMFDAGPTSSSTLLRVGETGKSKSHVSNPTFLYDICARAGGAEPGTTECFVTINSNNVVGDNLWLWRADHGSGAGWDTNRVRNGLIVNGVDVTMYGLFVEHCQEYQTVWNANGGRVYFYQSEMPYDPPSQQAWSHDGVNGYASYKVADSVTNHQAFGLGIYCYFTAAPVVADNAIETPTGAGIKMHNMCSVRLNGEPGSGISHVINGRGDGVVPAKPVRVLE
jgi:hypothetical protein